MSFRKTLIALVALAAIAAVFFLYEKPRQEKEAKEKETKNAVLTLDWEKLEKITIEAKPESIVLEKDGENWKVTAPYQDEADKFTVQGMVSDLRNAKAERIVDNPEQDWKIYGLAPPRLKVDVTAAGQTQTLEIGANHTVGNALFAKRSDSPKLLIVSTSLLDTFSVPPFRVRDKTIFPKGYDVQPDRIEVLENDQTRYAIVKEQQPPSDAAQKTGDDTVATAPETHWKLEAPAPWWRADTAAVDKVVQAIRDMRVETVVAETGERTAELGLAPPRYTLIARYPADQGGEVRLELGDIRHEETSQRLALVPKGYLAAVNEDMVQKLLVDPNDLKDRTLNDFNLSEVRKVRLQRGQNTIIISRSLEEPFTAEGFDPLDDNKVLSDLRRLVDLTGTAFLPDADLAAGRQALAKPDLVIELYGDGDRLLARVEAVKWPSATEPDRVVARGTASDSLYTVKADLLTGWPQTATDWVAKPSTADGADAGATGAGNEVPFAMPGDDAGDDSGAN